MFTWIVFAIRFTFCSIVHLIWLRVFPLIFQPFISFTEITPYFEPRNVTVKKGVDAKEVYDLLTEIGR